MRGARAALATVVCAAGWFATARPAHPAPTDDELAAASVIFVRGAALYRVDGNGRGETLIAELPTRASPRLLRSDRDGRVLLVELAGAWAWLPLDDRAAGPGRPLPRTLIDLPCGEGPAQLAEDGASVLCRAPGAANRSIVVELSGRPGRPIPLDIPSAGARILGAGAERRLVWADAGGIWTAALRDPRARTRVGDPPLRGFLPSPDGERAVGVYADQVYSDVRHTRPAELLMSLQLDGQSARRKAIPEGVAIEWSHDARWVLVQDAASACIMRATGGQYKCWKGLTAVALSSDGHWGLALGNRDGSRRPPAATKPTARSGKAGSARGAGGDREPGAKPGAARPSAAAPAPAGSRSEPREMAWDHLDEPSDEPEAAEPPPGEDEVGVALSSGPLALYRLRLDGAFTDRPSVLVKVVDGPAVWIPARDPRTH